MGSPVKYIAGIVALLLGALAVFLVVRSASGDADDQADRGVECQAAIEDAKAEIDRTVEDAIWQSGLFKTDKPVPKELTKHGRRVSITQMTDEEHGVYLRWREDNDALNDTMRDAVSDVGAAIDSVWKSIMTACSVGRLDACRNATERGDVDLARALEAAIWEHGIFRQSLDVPDDLVDSEDGQTPIPLDEISSNQLAMYEKWKRQPGYVGSAGRLAQDIQEANAPRWKSVAAGCRA